MKATPSNDSDSQTKRAMTEYENQLSNGELEGQMDVVTGDQLEDTTDLPNSLIITNIDTQVFSAGDLRTEFEHMFRKFEDNVTFQYFKSFRRVRVNFENVLPAAKARIQCHQMRVGDALINCYFAQPTKTAAKDASEQSSDSCHLQPPSPVRQFLISPPASPPVGWEPVDEAQPLINYELLNALSRLTPGEAHELHPPSGAQPGIVVHICEDNAAQEEKERLIRLRIQQTRRPPVRGSSEGSDDSDSMYEVSP